MALPTDPEPPVETDSRFPSGAWKGFFLQPALTRDRLWMDLHLTFRNGLIRGEGRDRIGPFLIAGRYELDDGRCRWSKRYLGKHDVAYHGYNEGKGIWGTWQIPPTWHGGFHIWPVAMGDPSSEKRAEEVDPGELELVGAPSERTAIVTPGVDTESFDPGI